jgi:hypothetical protein
VTVDNLSADWIRVDGVLDFVTNSDSSLTVETVVVTPTGTLRNHSQATSTITFIDDGPISDPFRFERGLLSHGVTDIDGVDKRDWTTFQPTSAGATQLTVADASGWHVGDQLVIGDSDSYYANYTYSVQVQDDIRTITAIVGNVITVDSPLAYAHDGFETQLPVVINTTRNITFTSASSEVDRLGHVMLMHSTTHSVKDAAFERLGRTDKSRPITDPDGLGDGVDNPRGRYPLHFHRGGGVASGVSVVDSPGWGVVNHDSHVDVNSSVSYDVFGAHFVTETGIETGSFTNNVAVRSVGTGRPVEDERVTGDDTAHSGIGFWADSGPGNSEFVVSHNIAIGHKLGFVFFQGAENFPFPPVDTHHNVSYGTPISLQVWGLGGNGNAANLPDNLIHDNLLQGSVGLGYAAQITLERNTIAAFDAAIDWLGIGHTGVLTNITYIDNTIKDFRVGIHAPTEGDNAISGGYYDNLESNIVIQNTQANRHRTLVMNDLTFGDRATWNVEMQASFFTYQLLAAYPEGLYGYSAVPDWQPLFFADYALGQDSEVTLDGVDLFFEEQGRDFQFGARLTRFPDEIRLNPDGSYATTGDLNDRGLYVGGEPLPSGLQYYLPKVRGVLVAP